MWGSAPGKASDAKNLAGRSPDMSKWCSETIFFSKIWPNPGCGFSAIFEIWGPPVEGFQKRIKDFRGAIKSLQRAIKSAQKAIKIHQKRSAGRSGGLSFI